MWLSLIQAAILSGRNIQINPNSESGCADHIIWLQLDK
jgi:hypothetical protein